MGNFFFFFTSASSSLMLQMSADAPSAVRRYQGSLSSAHSLAVI